MKNKDKRLMKQLRSADELANLPRPPKPSWFDARLRDIGGVTADGRPRLRVIWGQDPDAVSFRAGKVLPVYIGARWSQWMETKIAGSPVAQIWEDEKWIGVPRWFVEIYEPPEDLDETDWDNHRYDFNVESGGELIDNLGPFPRAGRYIPFIRVEDKEGALAPLTEEVIAACQYFLKLIDLSAHDTPDWATQRRINEIARIEAEMEAELAADLVKEFTDYGKGLTSVAVATDNCQPVETPLPFEKQRIREIYPVPKSDPYDSGIRI